MAAPLSIGTSFDFGPVNVWQSMLIRGSKARTDANRQLERTAAISHNAHEYVSFEGASANAVEGFRAAVKRGINGTHRQVGAKVNSGSPNRPLKGINPGRRLRN